MAKMKRLFLSLCLGLMMMFSIIGLTACGATVENFNLVFRVDNESYVTISTNGSEMVAIPENPSKEGYTFEGWFWDNGTWEKPFTANSLLDAPISSDMSIYAKFDTIDYIITYANGGTHNNPASYTVEDSFALSNAEKIGYTFDGWYNGGNEVSSIDKGSKGDLTLTAQWTTINYTITYTNTKDVENDNIVSYTIESDTIVLNPLVKTGYTFEGWYNGETEVTEIVKGSTGNIELAAKWTPIGYEITYHNVEGATNANPETYDVEDEPLALINAVKEGYTFIGWYTDATYQNMIDEIVVGTIGDLDLYAKFDIINYNITYVYDQTKVTANENAITYTILDSVSFEDLAVIEHYQFDGWFTDNTYQTPFTGILVGMAGEKTVYGKITPKSYSISYLNTKGAENKNPTIYTIESEDITFKALSKEGYDFDGWSIATLEKGSTGNKTITANWTAISYTITYENTKGAENKNPTIYTIESEDIIFKALSKEGYDFDGWSIATLEKGSTGNKTITANWTTTSYTITYVFDDTIGELEGIEPLITTYTIEDSFAFAQLTNKTEGYIFTGWYTAKEIGNGVKVEGIELGTVGNKTYFAQWGLDTYSINYYNTKDAINTNLKSYTVETDNFSIADISVTGYKFLGWYSDDRFETIADTIIEKGSTGNINLYAKWEAVSYSISYTLYGGEVKEGKNPESYTIEDSVEFINPVKNGYVFVGWYDAVESGSLVKEIMAGNTGTLSLYARWLRFESNGGTIVDYIPNFNEDGLEKPEEPEKDYYEFNGWFFDVELKNKYDFNTLPTATSILYAKWTPIEYTINYVLYDGENHKNNPITYNIEDEIIFEAPTKVGYAFNGWYSNAQFNSALVEGIALGSHGELTLYASFSIKKYIISFESNGGTDVEPIKQDYATTVLAPENPAKIGYEFNGWYLDNTLKQLYTFSTMPAEDITLYAKWNLVDYAIKYHLDSGVNSPNNPETYTINSATITLNTPTKLGYSFVGWYLDSDFETEITQITSGSYGVKELYAKWDIIVYSINYHFELIDVINENISSYTVETDVTTLQEAILKGYTFNGWYTNANYLTPITTIAGGTLGELNLYGKFTANEYEVWLEGNDTATVTVSFDMNGANGTAPVAQTVSADVGLNYPEIPIRDGYLFGGWYEKKDCSGMAFDFSAYLSKDITLYAKWLNLNGSNAITVNGSASVTLVGTTEIVYKFVPLVSGNVSITTVGSLDTVGRLYKDSILLKESDDDGENYNFLIIYNVSAGEMYEIRVRGLATSVNGTVELSVNGNNNINAGGCLRTSNQITITYGNSFEIEVPPTINNYKFLGWESAGGVLYTDENGNSIRNWDIAENAVLYSKWEKLEYTLTIDWQQIGVENTVIKLEYGARIDLNEYVPNVNGKVYIGLYSDMYLTEEYIPTTMPDKNLTVYAKWSTLRLGTLKCNADKKAVKANETITAELFGAVCIDNGGKSATFTVTIIGTQAIGEIISVKIVASTEGIAETQTITINDVKVYGAPELALSDTSKDYINLDNLVGSWFGAIGTDTFGNETEYLVRIEEGKIAGDIATVFVDAIDVAGNVTTKTVENISLYGKPVISYNTEKTAVSTKDTLTAELFGATAIDSFGNDVEVVVSRYSGSMYAGNSIVVRISATDSKGNTKIIDITVKVYGTPKISNATTTDFKVDDEITPEALGLSATDTYGELLDVILTVKSGNQVAGEVYILTATATDTAGNVITKDFSCKIYGLPTITYDRTGLKVGENPVVYDTSATVSFNSNGGTAISSQMVTDKDALIYPTVPTKTGYAFKGWYKDSACTELYDFTAPITQNIVLYAGWETMVSSSYYSRNYVDITKGYNSDTKYYSVSTSSTSSTNKRYVYFTALTSGTYNFYYKNGSSSSSYRTYVEIYNATQNSSIRSNATISNTSYTSIRFNATAGDVIYVSFYRYSSSSNFYFYVTGGITPEAGGLSSVLTPLPENCLGAVAKDSFGKELDVYAILDFGTLEKGEYVGFTLTAVDHLGNVGSIRTSDLGVYDIEDIQLTLIPGAADAIKQSSKGEEFYFSATDTFNNGCILSVVMEDGSPLEAGENKNIYLVATDLAGNVKKSGLISGITVYGLPSITAQSNYITESTANLQVDFYTATNSVGNPISCDVVVEGELVSGNIVTVTVTAVDTLGNVAVQVFKYIVDYDYSVDEQTQEITIKKYVGNGGDISIPDMVSYIGNEAFKDCTTLNSIVIPETIKGIGYKAFYNCSGLTKMTIPFIGASVNGTSNAHFGYIFGASSYSNNSSYVPTSLIDVIVTGGESVPNYAFYNCRNITNIELPDGILTLGTNAFYNCDGLATIEIPNSVKIINANAFSQSENLLNIEIPDGVESIGKAAFEYCSSLTTITIGKQVKNIGENAFRYCEKLERVDYTGTINDWVMIDFYDDYDVINAYFYANPLGYANHLYIDGKEVTNVTLSDAQYISSYAFYNCSSLVSITIPKTVQTIGDYAFNGCSGITGTLVIPNSVNSIGMHAFSSCSGLTGELIIPNSVKSLKFFAFGSCSGLSSVVIPDSLETIGSYAFGYCRGLTRVKIGKGVTSMGWDAFYECESLERVDYTGSIDDWVMINFSSDSDSNPLSYAKHLYINDEIVSTIEFDTATEISNYALKNCIDLVSVKFTDKIVSIGDEAFAGCKNLSGSITIPNSVTIIGSRAFAGCSGLTSVITGSGVESIGAYAFTGCSGLTSVTIGANVKVIYCSAFASCSSMKYINFSKTAGWYGLVYLSDTEYDKYLNPSNSQSTNATYLTSTYADYTWMRYDYYNEHISNA